MKALVLESNGSLKYRDVPEPEIASDECLIKVSYAGICNSDIFRAYNNSAYFYPLIMGHEFSGIVEKTGTNVIRYKIGDRVAVFPLIPCKNCEYCNSEDYAQCVKYDYYGSRRNGSFAQFIAVKEWNLFSIPHEVSLKMASLLEPLSVALHAVRKVQFRRNHFVAIFGAGLIGLVIAKYLSSIVDKKSIFIIDRNDFKLSIAKDYGIHTINPENNSTWLKKLIEDTGGGVNHAIEVCGAVETYKQSLDVVKSHGSILWVGNIRGDMTIEKKGISSLLRKEVKIYGCWNSKFNHSNDDDWNVALQFIKSSNISKDLATHTFSLAEGETVFEKLYLNKIKKLDREKELFLKIIFTIE